MADMTDIGKQQAAFLVGDNYCGPNGVDT